MRYSAAMRRLSQPAQATGGLRALFGTSRLLALAGGLLMMVAPALAWPDPPPPVAPLTLAAAVSHALEHSERARIAQARTDAAEARMARARAVFWPDVTLSGNYTHRLFEADVGATGAALSGRGFSQPQDLFTATAGLSATLFDFRAYPLLRQARHARTAARLTEREDRRALAFEAAQAFVSTLGATQILAAAGRRRTLAAHSLDEARARSGARLGSVHDVTRSELEVHTADTTLAQAQASADQARLALATLLGFAAAESMGPLAAPVSAVDQAPASTSPLCTPPDCAVPAAPAVDSKVRARRADLEARRELLAGQNEYADEPGRRFVPSLRFDAKYQLSSEETMGGRNDDATLGLTLTWPIFDGFERDAEAEERRAVARELQALLDQAARSVDRDVQQALVMLTASRTVVASARAAAAASVRNADEAAALRAQGLAQAFEVADAQARQFEADVARTRAELGEIAARLQLSLALGEWPAGVEPPAGAGGP